MAPIKVRGRFATAHDTARTLGVSPARTRELINTARVLTGQLIDAKDERRARRASGPRNNVAARKRKATRRKASR